MRRVIAMVCCAACSAFGIAAGAAHVHEAADHHEEMRGLHLDHAHLGDTSDHGPGHHHPTAPPDDGEANLDARHIDHHEGDALYLTVTAQRSFDPSLRVLPALDAVGATIDPPIVVTGSRNQRPDRPRGPPREGPAPPRAPPV